MSANGKGDALLLASARTCVNVGFYLADQLRPLAQARGRDLTAEVRHALRQYIENERETKHV